MSKGQSINLDWMIALSLFLTTVLSSLALFIVSAPDLNSLDTLKGETFSVQSSLEDETYIEGREVPVMVGSPYEIGDVPIDSAYSFPEEAYPGSAVMDIPSEITEEDNRVITVFDLDNRSYRMVYFLENVSERSYSGQIQEDYPRLNNSKISVELGGPGLVSLEVGGNEILNSEADLDYTDNGITTHDIYGEAFNGNLKIYNGSSEIILEDVGQASFNLTEFSTLYWHPEGTQDLETGDYREGDTSGFTLASDSLGITFMGDLSANVSRPESSRTVADVDTGRLRIRLHEDDYTAGERRINSFDDGSIIFGAEEDISAAYRTKIIDLKNATDNEFESRLDIGVSGYNISYGDLENEDLFIRRGEPLPLGSDIITSEKPSLMVGRSGNYTEITNRVLAWR